MTIGPQEETAPIHGRILSVQSHVAFGYVGGKAAVFPLQCMGYDVDVVNTVNYSNHTGYGRIGGTKTSADELTHIFDVMQQSGVLVPDRILTGYIPNAESVDSVHELVKKLKIHNLRVIYLLDPVLGDAGKLYVSESCISAYRRLLPLATIISPNWFEVELLTEIAITDIASLRAALRKLHTTYHVPHVVISSIPLSKLRGRVPSYLLPPTVTTYDEKSFLICIASFANDNHDPETGPLSTVYAGCVESIPGYFTGVGDLFSALLLGHYQAPKTNPTSSNASVVLPPLAYAASHALSKTHAILTLTHESASAFDSPPTDDELDAREPGRKDKRMKHRELRIIQGQNVFRRNEWDGAKRMIEWEGFWDDSHYVEAT